MVHGTRCSITETQRIWLISPPPLFKVFKVTVQCIWKTASTPRLSQRPVKTENISISSERSHTLLASRFYLPGDSATL